MTYNPNKYDKYRNSGRFKNRVTVQKFGTADVWEDAVKAWATQEPLKGRELFEASNQIENSIHWKIRCRGGVESGMRLVHKGRAYPITAVLGVHVDYAEILLVTTVFDQTVTLHRNDPDVTDPYGSHPTIDVVQLDCRMDETSKVVKNQQGSEVVSTTQFMVYGWSGVSYADDLEWVDGFGKTVKRSPLSIEFIRDKFGSVQFLVVSV